MGTPSRSDPSSWQRNADELRETHKRCACIIGGGLCGLACAIELGRQGFAIVIVDPEEPGAAHASNCTGLLEPLAPKGRLMWRGIEAYDAAHKLILAASEHGGSPCFSDTGSLHVASSEKQATQLAATAHLGSEAVWLRAAAESSDANEASVNVSSDDEALLSHARLALNSVESPHGALYWRRALVVDTGTYLRQLWSLVQATTRAVWIRRTLHHVWAIASVFDLVVVAAGAACLSIDETRHLPLELVRGQVLEYTVAGGAGSGAADIAAAELAAPPALHQLSTALVGTVCILPHRREGDGLLHLDCGGTYEPTDPIGREQQQPADLDTASAQLHAPLLDLFPPLVAAGAPVRARAGVRALPPRCRINGNDVGTVPLAGRAHSCRCERSGTPTRDGGNNVWMMGGMGARGLLYHALLASWLAEAADRNDAGVLPVEVRRGEFAAMVTSRLERLLAEMEAEVREQAKVSARAAAKAARRRGGLERLLHGGPEHGPEQGHRGVRGGGVLQGDCS